jgi:hypothetical protein
MPKAGEVEQVCIYCRRRLSSRAFNREHVLSEAFGRFRCAPAKLRCVCRECNQYFGDELEARFARHALEALFRYRQRVKTAENGELDLRYVSFTLPGAGDWSGVKLGLAVRDGELKINILPQVSFRDPDNGDWRFFGIREIENAVSTEPRFKKVEMRIFAGNSQDQNAIQSKLVEAGVNFKKSGDLIPPMELEGCTDIAVDVTFTINQGIRRCIAKYALNYLAHVDGTAFCMAPDFDRVRRFARYGETANYPVVSTHSRPILRDELGKARRANGHLITLEWAGDDLVSQISLFNTVTYVMVLAHRFGGVWRPLRSGIFFDIERRQVSQLTGVSSVLIA